MNSKTTSYHKVTAGWLGALKDTWPHNPLEFRDCSEREFDTFLEWRQMVLNYKWKHLPLVQKLRLLWMEITKRHESH